MNQYEQYVQLREIIDDGDIEELKKFFYNEDIVDDMINWSLLHAAYNGKLNIVKYILNNYSDKISDKYIEWSLEYAYHNNLLDIAKYIELYKIIRKNNLCPGKYKNTIFLS